MAINPNVYSTNISTTSRETSPATAASPSSNPRNIQLANLEEPRVSLVWGQWDNADERDANFRSDFESMDTKQLERMRYAVMSTACTGEEEKEWFEGEDEYNLAMRKIFNEVLYARKCRDKAAKYSNIDKEAGYLRVEDFLKQVALVDKSVNPTQTLELIKESGAMNVDSFDDWIETNKPKFKLGINIRIVMFRRFKDKD